MIKLCGKLFYKPKYGNDADSMMLKRLFRTVTTVLICLAAISFSAYAFFASTVTSGSNTIKASRFSASVKIEKDQEIETEGKIQSYRFNTPGVYTVTITADDSTTGTGYGVITVNGTKYYTQQLGKDVNAPNQERKEVIFQLDVKATAEVQFDVRWGTNSNYNVVAESEFYIKNDPQKTIVVDAVQGAADNTDETKPENTEPDSTTESTTDDTTESTTVETTVPTTNATETVHIVQEGESLALIAKKYDTTSAKLAAYNNIENPGVIQIGQKIEIPPADWEIPDSATTPETTAPTEQTEPVTTLPEETQPTTQTTLPEETQPVTETTDAPLQ